MSIRCGHCGREDTRETRGSVVLSEEHEVVDSGAFRSEVSIQQIAQVDRCTGCGKPTLLQYTWVDEFMDPEDIVPDQLYPEQRDLADLPERVHDRYAAMLELQHAPDVFAVRAGKLLEAVCSDRGIPQTDSRPTLGHRLDALVKQGHVPKPLADQAHLVRDYRNLGSHDAELEVREQDVPSIRGFAEGLLDFPYWGPANLNRVTAELEERRREAAEESGS